MAHFAQLDDTNTVIQVIVISNDDAPGDLPDSETAGQAFIATLGLDGVWKQTSYNGNFRKNYAGQGFTYDATRDAFIPPKPDGNWTLNEATCQWVNND